MKKTEILFITLIIIRGQNILVNLNKPFICKSKLL